MTGNAECIRIDPEHTLAALREAIDKVSGATGEVILDFGSVSRIDADAAGALAALAEQRSVRVVLRGVNVRVYKVLKLLKLTERFGFVE